MSLARLFSWGKLSGVNGPAYHIARTEVVPLVPAVVELQSRVYAAQVAISVGHEKRLTAHRAEPSQGTRLNCHVDNLVNIAHRRDGFEFVGLAVYKVDRRPLGLEVMTDHVGDLPQNRGNMHRQNTNERHPGLE